MVSLGSMASIRLSSARASSSRPRWAIGDDFDPHRCDDARLVVQGAVGPFDRLFEAPRGEMSESDINGVAKGIRIERAQTARPFDGFDRRLGLVAQRVDISLWPTRREPRLG